MLSKIFAGLRREPEPAALPRTGYRQDINGLRGLAIALVVFFHVFDGRVSAGVDIFLLIGGYFFFKSQINNAARSYGIRLWQSVVRLIRRLAPALLVVVGLCTGWMLLANGRWMWSDILSDVPPAVGYYMNIALVDAESEYAQAGTGVSPFQHLWSMSVQMQIYLVAMVAFAFGAVLVNLALKRSESLRVRQRTIWLVAVSVLSVCTLLSFLQAMDMSASDQMANYYSTGSRFWEVGLGGLAGLLLIRIPVPHYFGRILGYIGMAMIMATPFFLNGVELFPGPWTLFPLTGALLVILAGQEEGRLRGVNRLLATQPFQFLGRISYALYLWHWPLLIILMVTFGVETHSVPLGIVVIISSVLLAMATHRWIEIPLGEEGRPERGWPSFSKAYQAMTSHKYKALAGAGLSVLAVVLLFSHSVFERTLTYRATSTLEAAIDADYPGAKAALEDRGYPDNKPVLPLTTTSSFMQPQTQEDGCYLGWGGTDLIFTQDQGNSDIPCVYGDIGSEDTLYLIGASHSEHYLPALDAIGKKRGFAVIPMLKMGCPFNHSYAAGSGRNFPECAEWSANVINWVKEHPPTEGVFMTTTRPAHPDSDGTEYVPTEYYDAVSQFSAAGITTFGVRDNPWPAYIKDGERNMRICVAAGNSDCSFPDTLGPIDPSRGGYAGLDVVHINLQEAFCQNGRCPGVVGNVLVYRDMDHLTNLFVETLTDEIDRQMFEQETPGNR